MPTGYREFGKNRSVMDVLYFIISSQGIIASDRNWTPNVKVIAKRLEQPQSTVSTKIQFLRKQGLIKKYGWEFEPNWPHITEVFKEELEKYVKSWLTDPLRSEEWNEKRFEKILKIFNQNRIRSILSKYSYEAEERIFEKNSTFTDVLNAYFNGLSQCEIPKNMPKLIRLKRLWGMKTMERSFVEDAENLNPGKNKRGVACLNCGARMSYEGTERVDFYKNKDGSDGKVETHQCISDGGCMFIPVSRTGYVYWSWIDGNKLRMRKLKMKADANDKSKAV